MPYTQLKNDFEEEDSGPEERVSTLPDLIENRTPRPETNRIRSKQTIQGSLADETYTAIGYKQSVLLTIFYHLVGLLSGGIIYLIAYWKPDWKVVWTKRQSLLNSADALILSVSLN